MEYRKKIELSPDTEYWFVEMGPLNFLNGGSSYPFPTEAAAILFATNHLNFARLKGCERDIRIRYPNGTTRKIEG